MRIFHIATLDDWKQSQESGRYTTSTYGRTLEDEGFIHAAYHDQVPRVRDRFYADVTEPLVVLEIETDLLDVPWREDQVDGETFPHVYGTLDTSAVVAWRPARFRTWPSRPRRAHCAGASGAPRPTARTRAGCVNCSLRAGCPKRGSRPSMSANGAHELACATP